jgi:hypothetical protein
VPVVNSVPRKVNVSPYVLVWSSAVIVSVPLADRQGAVDVADVVVRQAAPEGAAGDDVVVTDGGRADRAGAAQG